jgi:hypothetical protein
MASGSDNGAPGSVELSELEVALLALLSVRPMTGYEILRHHARALEPWWETPRTQIYPKLRELQKRGLIEHEYVVQESKPNKRLYSIGPARKRFSGSLGGPYRDSVFFELLSLDHLIAMTDLEVAGTDKALDALRRFGPDDTPSHPAGSQSAGPHLAGPGAEQASELLDAIREVS